MSIADSVIKVFSRCLCRMFPNVSVYQSDQKYLQLFYGLQALQKQSQKIEKLEETINAQASLIESQNEMMKELNKKLLENEQKLSDFFTAKEVVGRKRHADEDLNEAHEEKTNGEIAAKKMKT